MPNTKWSINAAAIALAVAACASSPGGNPQPTVGDTQEPNDPPSGAIMTGTLTVVRHVVQPGADASVTEDGNLRLEVRLKPDGEGGSRWVDDGSTYSYQGSYVDHSETSGLPVCISDNHWDSTGSGGVGSGMSLRADALDDTMLISVSVAAHATGHNQTVCDGQVVDISTGDTSDDMTVFIGCPNGAELEATGAMSTGYDFACAQQSAQGEGQTVVTGTVGPP